MVEFTGTGGGFKLFCDGVGVDTPDINDASRPITAGEKASCAKKRVAGEEGYLSDKGLIPLPQAQARLQRAAAAKLAGSR